MQAVVFHDVGDIRLEDPPEPKIGKPTDAIIRITSSAICGTDLHLVRGTMPGMQPGTILGHEAVGIVEELGKEVRNFRQGDRVVVCSTIACGSCNYCRSGYYSQCDCANPNGPGAGTAFFGGPAQSGPFNGLQAERALIPFANVTLVKLPDEVSDDQAILISDIFPTGYFGAKLAEIKAGDTIAVFGCGPVGQFAIAGARLLDAGRILAVDTIKSRLELARRQGAEVIDFNAEDPVEAIKQLTGGAGVDRAIDAVGVDAVRPASGPAAKAAQAQARQFRHEVQQVAPKISPLDGNWNPGDAPSIALEWAVESTAKAGTLAIIGVYPPRGKLFPIGKATNKNLTINSGNCNHRKYEPLLVNMVRSGIIDPSAVLSHREPLTSAIDAYRHFDQREPGWIKVKLEPEGGARHAHDGAPAAAS